MGEAKAKSEAQATAAEEMLARLKADPKFMGWSEEDLKWTCGIKEEFHTVVLRHGRKVTQMSLQSGAAEHAASILQANLRQSAPLLRAAVTLMELYNAVGTQYLQEAGMTFQQIQECQGDLERAAALQDSGQTAGAKRVSAGGIILDS